MGVRALVPDLPRSAWAVLAGDSLSALGSGLTVPFLLVYLHRVRGIDLGVAGMAVSALAVAGFVGNPLGGWLADRFGAKRAVIAGLLVSAGGAASLVFVREAWHAFPATGVVGLGVAITWPAQDALLASLVGEARRSAVFSVRHATLNAGLGVGGLLAAAIVRDESARSFVTLYLLDALSFLLFVPILARVVPTATPGGPGEGTPSGGYAVVAADPVFRHLWLLTAGIVAVGYAQMHSSFPAFATRPGGVGSGAVGLAFAANTLTVVVVQLFALRAVGGRRRTVAIRITLLVWATAWMATVVAGRAGGSALAVALFALALAIFGVGETFLSPALSPIVNDLAPDAQRGRYNGAFVMAWTTGYAAGPLAAGWALDAGMGSSFFVLLTGVCVLLLVPTARLSARLPAAVDAPAPAGQEQRA